MFFYHFCLQMESEVTTLKRRYAESKLQGKAMKQTVRIQRDKSRQLIMACACKLQEKEAIIEKVSPRRVVVFYCPL